VSNQIDTLFGKHHETFLARLRRATRRRAKQAPVAKAIGSVGKLIRLREDETRLLRELRSRLQDYYAAMEDGMDAKLAKLILSKEK